MILCFAEFNVQLCWSSGARETVRSVENGTADTNSHAIYCENSIIISMSRAVYVLYLWLEGPSVLSRVTSDCGREASSLLDWDLEGNCGRLGLPLPYLVFFSFVACSEERKHAGSSFLPFSERVSSAVVGVRLGYIIFDPGGTFGREGGKGTIVDAVVFSCCWRIGGGGLATCKQKSKLGPGQQTQTHAYAPGNDFRPLSFAF